MCSFNVAIPYFKNEIALLCTYIVIAIIFYKLTLTGALILSNSPSASLVSGIKTWN